MEKYRETLLLILVMCLLGGGIHLMEVRGIIETGGTSGVFRGPSTLRNSLSQLEQISRITHDYLNGYLSGADWGTALPDVVMKEEMAQLQYKFKLVEEMATYLDYRSQSLGPLLEQYRLGFTYIDKGLKEKDIDLLVNAHQIFHTIDYEVFNHRWSDPINVYD